MRDSRLGIDTPRTANYYSRLPYGSLSALAQLVEQLTVNQWVAGSSPAGGAILSSNIKGLQRCSPFLFGGGKDMGCVGNAE